MDTKKIVHILIAIIVLLASSCDRNGDSAQVPDRSNLKIVLLDSLDVEYDDDERRLPESIRNLCAVISSEDKNCTRPYILDPILVRIDQNKELSIKTTIEKGGSKDVSNPKVIGKLIQKNFDEVEVPKEFLANRSLELDINKVISEFTLSKAVNDSLIIFIDEGPKEYTLNNKIYKVYSSIDEVRTRIASILCENDKANFTLLFNPPKNSVPHLQLTLKVNEPDCKTGKLTLDVQGGNGSPILFSALGLSSGQSSNVFNIPKKQRTGKKFTFVATQSGVSVKTEYTTSCPVVPPSPPVPPRRGGGTVGLSGDLTIIKGTEGCDICTRYYSATDNTGRIHEVKEKNSTFCCPCDKTVQIRGRTYRMECDGNNNRLALVE